MDIIFIRGIQINAIIGIHDWEKQQRRPLIVDLELASDITRAAATDQIIDALDYAAVTARLTEWVINNRFELVETLAEHCAARLREEFNISWLRLTLHKPDAVGAGVDVGVVIERGER